MAGYALCCGWGGVYRHWEMPGGSKFGLSVVIVLCFPCHGVIPPHNGGWLGHSRWIGGAMDWQCDGLAQRWIGAAMAQQQYESHMPLYDLIGKTGSQWNRLLALSLAWADSPSVEIRCTVPSGSEVLFARWAC
ncbi:MAG: hypothetical protein ACR2N1_22555 [Rubripirellula sp.]